MKNNYMILALLPILFQSALYCEDQFKDINQIIMPQLQSAQRLMRSSTALELQPILDALVSFSKKRYYISETVDQMKFIKFALAKYRAAEYKTTWDNICWFFGSNPKKVVEEIDPAIKKVDNALEAVRANLKPTDPLFLIVGGILALSAIAVAAITYNDYYSDQNEPQDYVPANSRCNILDIESAYATLELNYKTANPAAAKSAYKELARTHHPDKGGNAEKFIKIKEANDFIQECAIA